MLVPATSATRGPGRKFHVGCQPVEFAGACTVETDLDRRAAKGGQQGGFEVALEIEDDVEWPVGKLHRHFDEAGQTRFSFQEQNFIHGRMSLEQGGPSFLKEPRDVGLGSMAFDGVDDRKGMDDVSNRAEEDDADPGFRGKVHDRGKSCRQREGISFSEKPRSPHLARFIRDRRRRSRLAFSTWGWDAVPKTIVSTSRSQAWGFFRKDPAKRMLRAFISG